MWAPEEPTFVLFGNCLGFAIGVSVTLSAGSELDPFWFYFRPVARPDLKPLSIKEISLRFQ